LSSAVRRIADRHGSKTNKMRIMICRGRREKPTESPPANEFRMIKSAEETSHLEHVKDRRSQADGDRLMAESLRPRDHPEEFRDVWTAGPSPRGKA
jgi:hypothetical protein